MATQAEQILRTTFGITMPKIITDPLDAGIDEDDPDAEDPTIRQIVNDQLGKWAAQTMSKQLFGA